MPLELREITQDSQFPALLACEHHAFTHPFNPFWTLLHPEPGTDKSSRIPGFHSILQRQLAWHRADPTSHWFAVVDTDLSDMIVGGACWNEHTESPLAAHYNGEIPKHPLDADWWPEGEQRDFANGLLDQWLRPRSWKMDRPHMLLAIMFVHPDHRRRGVGSVLMDWGVKRADELQLDAFVEATDDGKPLYEAHGFEYLHTFYMEAAKRAPCSETWSQLEKRLETPIHCHFMWRAKGGSKVEKGEVPWDRETAEREGVSVCKWRSVE